MGFDGGNEKKLHFFEKKLQKNLHNSKIVFTFASQFRKKGLLK